MIRISAEFESPELAELAVKRVKESVKGYQSSSLTYNKMSDKAAKLRSGNIYTVIPTAVTSQIYLTAVMEFPASEDIIEEPMRSRRTHVSIYCEDESRADVRAILNAMGGMGIR